MRVIVTSQEDIAGRNIFRVLREELGFAEAGEFEGMPLLKRGEVFAIATERRQTEAEHLDEHFPKAEYYVFATRHKAREERRTLTVHVTGNLGREARVGGSPETLAYAQPSAMKVALLALERARRELNLGYEVSFEATHHGPTQLSKPVLFVEVGSTEKEWRDMQAVRAVARAALEAALCRESYEACVGVGGTHYAPRHSELALETQYAVGHIIPSYALPELSSEVFAQAVEKSGAGFVYLDWKGMKRKEREKALALAEELGVPVKRRRDLRAQSPALAPLRVDLELVRVAEKLNSKRVKQVLGSLGIVAERDESGKIKGLLSERDAGEALVRACLDILSSRGELSFNGSELVLTYTAFDPAKAAKLGLRPGPEYARLSRGESVVVGETTITPEMVLSRRELRIQLKDGRTLEVLRKTFKYPR
ncbi:MAG: hypothetical protein GXO66_08465 [Euryarchaeota archaeon]|nr:hypothetical protein [Euryarchaeota archaeon]